MPEATQKFFWIPRGDRGASKRGAAGGPVFLKSAFFVFFVIFLQTLADIDVRNPPKSPTAGLLYNDFCKGPPKLSAGSNTTKFAPWSNSVT